MRPQLAAVSLLLSSAVSFASTPPSGYWIELRSPHFLVLTDSDEKNARRLADQFERMRSVFHVLLPESTADSGRITVVALRDTKEFQALEPAAYLAKGQTDLAGVFLRASDSNYILVSLEHERELEHPYATVYHEYTHLLNARSVWLPLWLNEGMAEFYQSTNIGDKDVRVGEASTEDLLYLRKHVLLPLDTILTVDAKSPYYHEEQKSSVFYAQSWALTHYLILNDHNNNTHRLHDYIVDVAAGQDSLTAARNAFGDLKKLEADLVFYVSRFNYSSYKLSEAFPVDESTYKVAAISTADVNAVRAEVLVSAARKAEALTLLQNTLRDDPKNANAHAAMGFLKMREGDLPAARKSYDEAVALGSQSALAQYYSAILAERAGDTAHPEAIQAELEASIRLDPTYAAAYDALAQFDEGVPGKLEQAHTLSMRAVELDPANINYRVNAAGVLMAQQHPEAAIQMLKEAEDLTATPAQHATVRARLEEIEHLQTAATSFTAEPAPGAASSASIPVPNADEPHFPAGPPAGAQHVANGIVRNVKCFYPTTLSLDLESAGKSTTYYVNDYLKVAYFNLNFVPNGALDPCKDIEGMKAAVHYTAVADKIVAGQIVRLDLTK